MVIYSKHRWRRRLEIRFKALVFINVVVDKIKEIYYENKVYLLKRVTVCSRYYHDAGEVNRNERVTLELVKVRCIGP